VNYKIFIEIEQQVCIRKKIHNVNGPTLWYGWHGFEQSITNNATDFGVNVSSVCSCTSSSAMEERPREALYVFDYCPAPFAKSCTKLHFWATLWGHQEQYKRFM